MNCNRHILQRLIGGVLLFTTNYFRYTSFIYAYEPFSSVSAFVKKIFRQILKKKKQTTKLLLETKLRGIWNFEIFEILKCHLPYSKINSELCDFIR